MITLNLKAIIDQNGLDETVVAQHLFPSNKHPRPALERVIKGDAFLDTNQVSRLSSLTGIPIDKLFDSIKWETVAVGDIITFSKGEYTAELNLATWMTKLYHNKTVFHEELLVSKSIPMSVYIQELENLINKHK